MSERVLDELGRSNATFSSVDRLKFLSLSYFTDKINVSICVANGANIAFILLSFSLEDNLRSSS